MCASTRSRREATYVLGDLGRIGADENYVKPIGSNTVRFFVSPDLGAQFEVQVLDQELARTGRAGQGVQNF